MPNQRHRLSVLVLGARGMLGHMLVRVLSVQHDVYGTSSARHDDAPSFRNVLPKENWVDQLDVGNWFEGTPGVKLLSDTPNASGIYGTTKKLGEVDSGQALTLRTGFVGRQLSGSEGLFEWVYSQRGKSITGFRNAIYSGLTTMALARVIQQVIQFNELLTGLYQVASEPISKFDLITRLNVLWDLGLTITPDSTFVCDRSLDGSSFCKATNITIPSWDEMLAEFVKDGSWYTKIRGNR